MVGSMLPPVVKPPVVTLVPKVWIVPPVRVVTTNSWRNLAKRPDRVEQAPLGLGQRLQGHGPAAAPEERHDHLERQERPDRRLGRVLAHEVEDELVGERGQDLGPVVEQLADAGDRAEVQGRDLAAGRPGVVEEAVGRVLGRQDAADDGVARPGRRRSWARGRR